ncbi:Protein FecR [Pseudomonas fluorescens]|uniref:Protein FecR n=1 Tax=Pseudomonas fluorescens TaxID=294 RepID=A0A5E6XHF0_PSEFL|nr:FecR family protein [Pseudomonas fluorescens]VVN40733.1 Protein FecR [Pseudomonas fluorescens]
MISEAAYWLTLLHDDLSTEADRQAFDAWCEADPRHAVALERMRGLWGSLDDLPAAPARVALKQAFARSGPKASGRSAQALALFGVLFCGWIGLDNLPVWLADQRTGFGERREVALADGSRIQLNSHSALNVKFDGHQRVIELLEGEMWVEVAKDAQRPFVVRTDQGTATALGTRYLVKRETEGSTVVSVLESVVAAKANGAEAVNVAAGEQTTLRAGKALAPKPIGNSDPDAWTRGLLKVDDRPLSEVLQALAGYRRGVVRYDEQALQGLRVSGVFRLDDTDAALATLADNLPIKVEHFTGLLVLVKPL